MNVTSEIVSLSKHLMLFLVAVFAFSMKELLAAADTATTILLICALLLAAASFVTGYSVIFTALAVESENPASHPSAPPPPLVVRSIKLQYWMTMTSLATLVSADVWHIIRAYQN
ncbi:MAG: hypothetical protein ACYC7A_11470 [Thermoanaerobaculia bacterium]